MPQPIRLLWYADKSPRRRASIRLRMFEPMRVLAPLGYRSRHIRLPLVHEDADGIVIAKSFSRRAIRMARAYRARGKAVIVDICDNLIWEGDGKRVGSTKWQRYETMLKTASLVTFSTEVLERQYLEAFPFLAGETATVPDGLDRTIFDGSNPPSLTDRIQLLLLRRFLDANSGALHTVWFGNSHGRLSGYVHVEQALARIEQLAPDIPITLTVISRNWLGFQKLKNATSVPLHFVRWSVGSFGAALACHDAAVIPVTTNEYTQGKTINRPGLALLAGLGVIADALPAYEELRPYVFLDDWGEGIRVYAQAMAKERERIAAGRAHIEQVYGDDAVAAGWHRALSRVLPGSSIGRLP